MIPFRRDRYDESRITCLQLQRVLNALDLSVSQNEAESLFRSYAGDSDKIGWYDFKQIYELKSRARETKPFQLALKYVSCCIKYKNLMLIDSEI